MTSETVNASGETSLLASDSSPVSNPSKVVQPDGQRSKLPVRLASIVGVAIAFVLVLVWFPKTWNMWNMPIQAIDAPSHYYFIRKLLKNGLSVAFELNPNDSFYPPLFHILVYALIKLAGLFGISVNIFTGLNLVWLFTSGLVFPAGMLLWCSYFFSDLPRSQCIGMCFLVPLLSVTSASHPYWLFDAGPLFAYGLATSLLPFSLYAGLRLIDALSNRKKANLMGRGILFWVLVNLVLSFLLLLAHPRIAFTYLVLIVFFILFKLSWKFIVSAAGCCCLAVALFTLYVMYRDHGKNYLNPSTWFHTFQPTRDLASALGVLLTNNLSGLAGIIIAVCICLAILASLLLSGHRFREGLALVFSFFLVGLIYVCSAAVSGPLANMVTAAWYRGETRPLAMLPLAIIPLLVFGSRCVLAPQPLFLERFAWVRYLIERRDLNDTASWFRTMIADRHLRASIIMILSLILVVVGNLFNPVRTGLSELAAANTVLDREDKHSQLTRTKLTILTSVRDRTEQDAVIISDPLNGSMYGMTLYGLNMLYPIYNPMDTKNGKIFGQVERSFSSGKSDRLLNTVCPVNTSFTKYSSGGANESSKYFLSMGPQATDLQMFTYKAQYDPFHDQHLIDDYVRSGTLHMVEDFGSPTDDETHWVLYRFNCH